MATRASKKKKKQRAALENKNESRERNASGTIATHLPDDILQHIFSFLPIKSIAQTTLLSRHWKHLCLWRSHPHLDFSPLSPQLHSPRQVRLFHKLLSEATEFVPDVLSRREQGSNITTFRLFGHVSCSCLRDCIDCVMHHGIEQLELDVYLDSGFNLPPGMYNCNTLQVLTLNHQETHPVRKNVGRRWGPAYSYGHFNYPTSAGLPSVHTLSLTNVYLKYGSDLFSGGKFPLLRNLCLKTCSGMHDLNINCPGLEILKLEDLELQALGVSGVGLLELEVENCFKKYAFRWAKILAPSLQSLRWRSSITVEFTTESFRDLNTCSLYFPSEIQNAATLENTSTFLSALCFARSLAVGSQVLETLSKINSRGGLPCSFDNLMTLEFHTNMTKDEITGMTCLLRSSPILHTITISVNSCSNAKNESWKDYWKYQFQNLKLIELHLKVARIDVQDTKMHYNALNLVKLLLGPGQALQEMTLTLRSNPVVPLLQQRRIRSQIMKIVRASCNVIVSFLPQD